MKLDYELFIRILTTIEEAPIYQSFSVGSFIDENQFPDESEDNNCYTPYELEYMRISKHMKMLVDVGLLDAKEIFLNMPAADYVVKPALSGATGLTAEGYQYLQIINDDKKFSKIKDNLKSGFWNITQALGIEFLKSKFF